MDKIVFQDEQGVKWRLDAKLALVMVKPEAKPAPDHPTLF